MSNPSAQRADGAEFLPPKRPHNRVADGVHRMAGLDDHPGGEGAHRIADWTRGR